MSKGALVSIGLPVRNGAASLQRGLDSVLRQSHANIEIILSDNASTDGTFDICRGAALGDARVRLYRQERPLTALAHFRYVFDQATAPYFLWAAHDDWRSENYIEVLLAGLEARPGAVLAFSDVVLFKDLDEPVNLCASAFDFRTDGLELKERLRKTSVTAPLHIYGLMRSDSLRGYPWYESEYAPDWPIMSWLATRGEFVYVPGAYFLYHWPGGKTDEGRARANAYRALRFGFRARIAWMCADAIARASHAGKASAWLRWRWLPQVYLWQQRGLKNLLFTRSPVLLQRVWRRLKPARELKDEA